MFAWTIFTLLMMTKKGFFWNTGANQRECMKSLVLSNNLLFLFHVQLKNNEAYQTRQIFLFYFRLFYRYYFGSWCLCFGISISSSLSLINVEINESFLKDIYDLQKWFLFNIWRMLQINLIFKIWQVSEIIFLKQFSFSSFIRSAVRWLRNN